MSAIWPSIAEGFLTARLRVTYYTMKNCRLSDSLIAATKRNVIPATKSFYKYLKIFFAIHYISRMFSCESVFLRWNARLLTYWLREQDFARFETMGKLSMITHLRRFPAGWMIYNGNWTEWGAIWTEIICVISKLNERAARVRFEITSVISDQNCTTRDSITTLLHPFWNRSNTGLGQLKYFIDAASSWFEIKFIHFWGKKITVLETKVAKFAIRYSLSFIFLQFDRLL